MAVGIALGVAIQSKRIQTPKELEAQDNLLGMGPIIQMSPIMPGDEAFSVFDLIILYSDQINLLNHQIHDLMVDIQQHNSDCLKLDQILAQMYAFEATGKHAKELPPQELRDLCESFGIFFSSDSISDNWKDNLKRLEEIRDNFPPIEDYMRELQKLNEVLGEKTVTLLHYMSQEGHGHSNNNRR